MKSKYMLLGYSLAGLLAVIGTAEARYVSDGTLVNRYYLLNSNSANWTDRIGGSQFEVFGVDVNTSSAANGTLNLSIYTNYGLTNETSFGTRTADIAFKLTGEDDFNHGIVLYNHGTAARKDTNSLTAGFYEVGQVAGNPDWKTSQTFFGDHTGVNYSGIAADCTSNATCAVADQFAIDTYINQGNLLVGNNGSANGFTLGISVANNVLTPDDPDTVFNESVAALYRIDVTMTGIGGLFGPGWEMVFGNATCGTDTIFVTGVGIPQLPEPATMGVMLLGLIGLGAARRATKSA